MAIDRDLEKQAQQLAKEIQETKSVFYDLETASKKKNVTGWTDSKHDTARPITFSAYEPTSGTMLGGKGNEILIDLGSEEANLSAAEDAMNIFKNDKLIESSKQLRQLLLNRADADLAELEKVKIQLKKGSADYASVAAAYKAKKKNISQILTEINKTFGKNITMVGFNNKGFYDDETGFDDQIMRTLAEKYNAKHKDVKATTRVANATNRLFGYGNTKDVRNAVLKIFEENRVQNARFTGHTNLQDLALLVRGHGANAAHSADDDVQTTKAVADELTKKGNIYEKFAKAIAQAMEKKGLTDFNTRGEGVDSTHYKQLFDAVYQEMVLAVQQNAASGKNATDIDVDTIVDTYMSKATGQTYGYRKKDSMVSAQEVKKQAEQQAKGQRQRQKQNTQKKVSEAKAFVQQLLNSKAVAGDKKIEDALTGKHFDTRAKMIGKDFTNATRISVADYLEEIYDQAAKWGVGVTASIENGKLRVGFYPQDQGFGGNWDDIANVELGLVDEKGTIQTGKGTFANLLYPTLKWGTNKKGKRTATPALTSAMEMQFKNIANLFGYNRDVDDPTKFTQNILRGNIQDASGTLRSAGRNALQGSQTTAQNKDMEEAIGQFFGEKNPEQLATALSMYSTVDLAQSFYSQFKEYVDEQYAHDFEKKKAEGRAWGNNAPEVNPYELAPAEIARFNQAYDMITQLDDTTLQWQAENIEDKILQAILRDSNFKYLRDTIRTFKNLGVVSNFEGIKEESVMKGLGAMSGSKDILPLNIWGDYSNRSLSQSFNYQRRGSQSKGGAESIFTSEQGRLLGVNYNSRERSQYNGAFTDDNEIQSVVNELIGELGGKGEYGLAKKLQDLAISVREGGVIMPESMAKELTSYREVLSKGVSRKKLNENLLTRLGITDDALDNLEIGQTLGVDASKQLMGSQERFRFGKNFSVSTGDLVLGLRKTAQGFQLVTQKLDTVKNGSKILTEGGGRYTARVINNDLFSMIANGLTKNGNGVQRASYLMERESREARKYMPQLSGRFSYIVQSALEQGKSIEEVYEVMGKLAPTWQKMLKLVEVANPDGTTNKKLQGNLELMDSGKVGYYSANGLKPLFSNKDQERRAFIEEDGSELTALGKVLLGEDVYEKTRSVAAQAVNMAKDAQYFESSGAGDATSSENGRVKFAYREREAFGRAIKSSEKAVSENNLEGLSAYNRVETSLQNTYGQRGLKAQEIIEGLEHFYDSEHKRLSPRNLAKQGPVVTLKWGNADASKGEIDISSVATDFNWENGVVKKENYEKSAMALVRQFMANNAEYANAKIALDLQGLRTSSSLNQAVDFASVNNYSQLTDIAPIQTDDGDFIPSLTDKIVTNIVRAAQEAAETGAKEGLDDAFTDARQQLKTEATDKDSDLFKAATESYMPNASYVKAIGSPDTRKVKNGTVNNTAFITSKRLKELLATSKTGGNKEYKKNLIENVKSLGWMYRAGTRRTKLADIDLTGEISNAKMTIDQLQKMEESLLDAIAFATKVGAMDITGQLHRYPSTSGMDIHHTKIAIDDTNVSDDAVMLGRGQSIAINADYDGDKTWLRTPLGSTSKYTNFAEYQKAVQAAQNLRQIEDAVADDLAAWDKANGGKKDKTDQLLADFDNRNSSKFAALMSKYNKGYVGQFSNLNTRVRSAMSKTGFDELSGQNGADAKFIRAFFEVFEQDAISAKKVFARLSAAHGGGEEGDQVAVDELTKLFDTILKGSMTDIQSAITQAQKMGILGDLLDSRQFQNARFSLRETDYDLYKQMGLDQYETVDDNGKVVAAEGIPLEVLTNALSRFNSYLTSQGYNGIKDAINSNWRLNQASTPQAKITRVPVKKASSPKNGKATVQTKEAQEEVKRAEAKAKAEAQKIINSFATVASDHIIIDNENGKHGASFVEDPLMGTIGLRENGIDSVTTLLKPLLNYPDESQQSFKDRQAAKQSAARRTFMHGLMELIGKAAKEGRKITADDLVDTEEYKQLKAALVQELGLSANEDNIALMRRRATATAKIGESLGLIGKNTQQEVNLGGYFTNSTGGLEGKGIKGTADVISYENGKAVIGDWKFSQDASPETFMERLLQANIYFGIEEKKVKAAIDQLEAKKKQNNNILSDEDNKRLEELTKQKNYLENGEVQIARNHMRDGQIVTEFSSAKRLGSEDIFGLLKALMNGDKDTAVNIANKAAANLYDRKYFDESGNETFSQDVYNQAKAQNAQKVSDLKDQGAAYKELINMEAELATLKARNNSEDAEDIKYLEGIVASKKESLNLDANANINKQALLQELQKRHQQIVEEINALQGLTKEQKQVFIDSASSEFARQRKSVNKAYASYEKVGAVNPKEFESLQRGWFNGQQTANRLKNDIAIAQAKSRGMSGQAAIQHSNYIARLQQSLNDVQMNSPTLTRNQNGDYVLKSGEREIVASKEQALEIQKQINLLTQEEAKNQLKLGANIQQNTGFLDRLKDNFKMSFSQIGNYVMGYFSFQGIERVIRQVTSATEQLDQRMVDLQIASGYTRDEINGMMWDFNKLGTEMGKTTQEIAAAANDWLRAGYEGAEASKLTEASMQLATLGMINSADATSYLISVLKGWKLAASDINGVVDKLTAVDMAAAISAGDLAEAMSRASNSAQMAGTTLDRYIGYLTTITDVTQKSAASVGESQLYGSQRGIIHKPLK